MYRLTIHVVEIMNLFDITASLLEETATDGWVRVATTSDTVTLDSSVEGEDPFTCIMTAVSQWAVSTISE